MAQSFFESSGRLQTENGQQVEIVGNTLVGAPVEEVAVTAEAIHAALVTLGLITAEA